MFSGLDGKVAIVTGAARGIGRAIAALLADCGMAVVVSDLDRAAAEQTAAELVAQGRRAMAVCVNVASASEVGGLVSQVCAQWNQVDVLINNAGITRDALIVRMKDEEWGAVLDVNLKGTYLCMKAVLPIMSKRRGGSIINISSVVGSVGNAGQANYAASKAAVIGLTKTVAREYAGRGVRVNAVAPGFIETAMTASLSAEMRTSLSRQIPMGRLGEPSDVARMVAFLASDSATYITGQVLHVDGGMYMGGA